MSGYLAGSTIQDTVPAPAGTRFVSQSTPDNGLDSGGVLFAEETVKPHALSNPSARFTQHEHALVKRVFNSVVQNNIQASDPKKRMSLSPRSQKSYQNLQKTMNSPDWTANALSFLLLLPAKHNISSLFRQKARGREFKQFLGLGRRLGLHAPADRLKRNPNAFNKLRMVPIGRRSADKLDAITTPTTEVPERVGAIMEHAPTMYVLAHGPRPTKRATASYGNLKTAAKLNKLLAASIMMQYPSRPSPKGAADDYAKPALNNG